jgi:hypothetical protein
MFCVVYLIPFSLLLSHVECSKSFVCYKNFYIILAERTDKVQTDFLLFCSER